MTSCSVIKDFIDANQTMKAPPSLA